MTARDVGGPLLWLLSGSLVALGVLSLPSIGLFVLPAAIGVLILAGVLSGGRGGPLLLVGAALPLLWVAWLNRGGPGERCFTRGAVRGCGDLFDPWVFALPGLVLLVLGVGLLLAGRARRSRGG